MISQKISINMYTVQEGQADLVLVEQLYLLVTEREERELKKYAREIGVPVEAKRFHGEKIVAGI